MFVAAGKKRKFAPASRATAEHAFTSQARTSSTHGPTPMGSAAGAGDAIRKYYALGQENVRERQYRAALDCYNRAIAIAMNEGVGKDAKIYEARAHVLYKLREFGRAMSDAKEAIVLDGNSAAGYTQMAGILAATGKPRDALSVLERGLATVDNSATGYLHMETLRVSVARQLDPSSAAAAATADLRIKTTDPTVWLPSDLAILILQNLDVRSLIVCRAVSKRWLALLDKTPVLWCRPCFEPTTSISALAQQLPTYEKIQRWIKQRSGGGKIPDKIIRFVFQKAKSSLVSATVPTNSTVSSRTLDALLALKRPCLKQIDISRVAEMRSDVVDRMLNGWCVPKNLTALKLPYCTNIDDDAISRVVRYAPGIRVLDISGCQRVCVKHMFRAWGSTLLDAHDSAAIEHLYINDHPGIPDFLVYSSRYRHFARLKTLHIAIYDLRVFSEFTSVFSLIEYMRRSQARAPHASAPFPCLEELNVDGVWDTPGSSASFTSNILRGFVFHTKIFASGLKRLSAIESSEVDMNQLVETLNNCLPTLQTLHLTKATRMDARMLTDFASSHRGPLPLQSLDLSGCVGISSHGLYALISCCSNLVYANLSGTAVDNRVMGLFTQMARTDSLPGIRALVLDMTDVTGAAVRDFAAACIERHRRLRAGGSCAKRPWKLEILDIANCSNVGSDAVAVVRELLSPLGTQIMAAVSA
ncbi:hypothetical protein GGI11_000234 [Coemansia sp. RSA 2049]|nr:hypothetical protein GGI11_000234 [Coemansia sp. RSA 2049]KAJ2597038.1 hypothetical protein EV177_007818 [Coemansia sp. RSA 1804]